MDLEQLKREIGQRLRKCRKELELTQAVFSERIGLQTKSYSNIETGQAFFSVEVLIKLTEVLNVSADYILFGVSSGKSPLNNMLEQMAPDDLERIEQIVKLYREAISKK